MFLEVALNGLLHGSGDTDELNVSEFLESSLRARINFKVQSDLYVNYLKVFIWGVNISLGVVIFRREPVFSLAYKNPYRNSAWGKSHARNIKRSNMAYQIIRATFAICLGKNRRSRSYIVTNRLR